MFPSSKNLRADESTIPVPNFDWLSNESFVVNAESKESHSNVGKIENIIKPAVNTECDQNNNRKRKASIVQSQLNEKFTLDRTKDSANIGASRTYFKHSISLILAIDNDVMTSSADTENFSVQEWKHLWMVEQSASSISSTDKNKRLKALLYKLQSVMKRNPDKKCFQMKDIEFRLRRQLGESPDELVSEWRKELRTSVFDHTGWMLYMDFLLSSSTLNMSHVVRDFKEYLNIQIVDITDNGGTYKNFENLINTLFSYALALSDAGYHETAIALYMALLEYNVVPDVDNAMVSIESYRTFWMSGRPRLGEEEYVNWTKYIKSLDAAATVSEDPFEAFNVDNDLITPLQWLQNEVHREITNVMPYHKDSPELEDPDRYVKFSDLFVFRIPLRAKHRLLTTILLQLVFILGPSLLPSLSSHVMCTLIEHIPSLYHLITSNAKLAGRVINHMKYLQSKQYLNRLCQQLLTFTSYTDMQRTVLLLQMSFSKNDAIQVLSTRRQNVELFAAFLKMYPSENQGQLGNKPPLPIIIAQFDNASNILTNIQMDAKLISTDEDLNELNLFNIKMIIALLEKDKSVFSESLTEEDIEQFGHVKYRRFLHYAKLAVQCNVISTEQFAKFCSVMIDLNYSKVTDNPPYVVYDCHLAIFIIEKLLRYQYYTTVRQWIEFDWIAALMYLYVENDKIRTITACKDECSTIPPIYKMKNLIKKVIDFYPNCVLFHRLRSRFSCQFLSDLESELAFTDSRLQLPFNKSLYLDHLSWVAVNCARKSDFDWKPLIKSMEQDRNLRIKLPLAEFYELLKLIDSEFREDTDSDATRLSEGPNETLPNNLSLESSLPRPNYLKYCDVVFATFPGCSGCSLKKFKCVANPRFSNNGLSNRNNAFGI
ncbi:hypothetical protein GJ496_004911 [Pomphorhynchus laevis]|nr:hypothetical protein GJ496_004911 [Pomphorhynchus laevis]